MSIKLKTVEDTIVISSPYDKEFTDAMHRLNGKWNSTEKTWSVDVDLLEQVRSVLLEVYGENDLTDDLVDVWVTVPEDYYFESKQSPLKLFGKVIATAWGRDSGAKWGIDIVNKSSECKSGGSVKNWRTIVEAGTFKIKKVSKSRIEADKEAYEKEGFTFEIVEKGIDRKSLIEEKERLSARIAEIDKLLSEEV